MTTTLPWGRRYLILSRPFPGNRLPANNLPPSILLSLGLSPNGLLILYKYSRIRNNLSRGGFIHSKIYITSWSTWRETTQVETRNWSSNLERSMLKFSWNSTPFSTPATALSENSSRGSSNPLWLPVWVATLQPEWCPRRSMQCWPPWCWTIPTCWSTTFWRRAKR